MQWGFDDHPWFSPRLILWPSQNNLPLIVKNSNETSVDFKPNIERKRNGMETPISIEYGFFFFQQLAQSLVL